MLSEKRLVKLLIEAEKAHKSHEMNLGKADKNWPRWYARFILKRIGNIKKK